MSSSSDDATEASVCARLLGYRRSLGATQAQTESWVLMLTCDS